MEHEAIAGIDLLTAEQNVANIVGMRRFAFGGVAGHLEHVLESCCVVDIDVGYGLISACE